jgi:hypothetical protein
VQTIDNYGGGDGRGPITMLIRTILESEGNQGALVEPVVCAVSHCMVQIWTDKGLERIAAFDQIPLMKILQTLRELEIGDERDHDERDHLVICIRNKLRRILGPPVLAKPKPKPKAKTWERPPSVTEETWAEYAAIREKLKQPRARIAA